MAVSTSIDAVSRDVTVSIIYWSNSGSQLTADNVFPVSIGADSASASGNFAAVLTKELGANITFCPGTFHGPTLIFEVKVQ